MLLDLSSKALEAAVTALLFVPQPSGTAASFALEQHARQDSATGLHS
jgi:hypothetical protein